MNLLPVPPQEEKSQFIWWSWFKNVWTFCSQLSKSLYRNSNNEVSVSSILHSFSPTVTGADGSLITNYATGCQYMTIGKLVFYSGVIVVNVAGAAAGNALSIQLPIESAGAAVGSGREDAITGNSLQCVIREALLPLVIWTYNNGTTIQNGYVVRFSIIYPIA